MASFCGHVSCPSGLLVVGGFFLGFWFFAHWLGLPCAFSIGCALLGWLAIRMAWPNELENFADEGEETESSEN